MVFDIKKRSNEMKMLFFVALMVVSYSFAAEKKPVIAIDEDALTNETQVSLKGTGDDHMAFVWWIPNEFWEKVLSSDASINETEKNAMLQAMSGISLLAVVQANISEFGAFEFFSKEQIEKDMKLVYIGADGKKQNVSIVKAIDPTLEVLLGVFKPILGAAMGSMGNSMHFFVLSDKVKSTNRLLNPYEKGKIDIQLKKKESVFMNTSIEFPLNSLYVPRICPNGKEAHISWSYCPWTGKRLPE